MAKRMEWRNTTRVPKRPEGVKDFDDMIDHLVRENKITNDEAFLLYYLTESLLQKERDWYCSNWGTNFK